MYKVTENINDTIPSHHTDIFQDRCNEVSLKKTKLTMKENKDVMKIF